MDGAIPFLDFQLKARNFCVAVMRSLLNLPAGSGKSLIALAAAQSIKAERVLVVCPPFLRINWIFEYKKWYPMLCWILATVIKTAADVERVREQESVLGIVGYSFFEKKDKAKALIKQDWDLIICDESQSLRKWESTRCKEVIRKLCKGKERLIFLSATPLVTSAADLHPTFSVMQPGQWGTNGAFKEMYCQQEYDHFAYNKKRYFGIKNADRLKKKAKSFVYTAKKSVILSQLPSKQIIDLPVDVGRFKQFESEDIEEYLDFLADENSGEDTEIKTERERIGLAKVSSVLDLLDTIPKSEPVVIFAWHRKVLHALYAGIKERGFKPRVIIGGMSEAKRMQKVSDFIQGKFKRLIVSISAGGLGINLQKASIGIFGELPYSYADFSQCCDRIHRIGSKKAVRIYKIIAVGSLDEHINSMMIQKENAAEAAGVLT